MSVKVTKEQGFQAEAPRYDVFVDGELVGQVMKTWLRNGGQQWTHSLQPQHKSLGYGKSETRKAAVTDLVQKASQG